MIKFDKRVLLGESPQKTGLFTFLVVAVFIRGLVFGDELLSPDVPPGLVAFVLFVLLPVGTAIQAFLNRSVVMGLLLSLALPLGVWAGTFGTAPHPLRHSNLNALYIGVFFAVVVGMTGHVVGMELIRKLDMAGCVPSAKEQWVAVGVTVIVVGLFLLVHL